MNTPDADTRRIGRRLGLLATLAFLALGWVSFDGAIERREDPNRNLVVAPGASELVLQRNRAGHYLLPGEINGHPVLESSHAPLLEEVGFRREALVYVWDG